jgi:hypothetical protein
VLVHVHPNPDGTLPQLPVLGAFATVSVELENLPKAATSSASASVPREATAASIGPGMPIGRAEAALRAEGTPPPVEPPPPAETPPPAPPLAPPVPAPAAPAPLCDGATFQAPHVPAPVGILWQRNADAGGAPFTESDFAGVVMAVCPGQHQLLLSSDDLGETGAVLVFQVPPKIKTSRLHLGESVLATAKIGAGGTLDLTGLASDEKTKGADSARAEQGDLVNNLTK